LSHPLPESARGAVPERGVGTGAQEATRRKGLKARRLAAGLGKGVGGAALSLAALYLAAYFGVNSSAANAWLERSLLRRAPRDAVTVSRVQWGPAPAWVWLAEPRGHGPDDRRTLRAHAVGLRLALDPAHPLKPRPTALVATRARVLDEADAVALHTAHLQAELVEAPRGELRLTKVRVDGFTVDLAWDTRGRSSVRRSFRLRTPRAPKPPPEGPPRPPPPSPKPALVVHLEDIALRDGSVRLRWPRRVLQFTDVAALGAVTVGGPEGLAITADARADRSELAEGRGAAGRRLAVPGVVIDGFRWRGAGFQSDRVLLAGVAGAPPLADAAVSWGPSSRTDVRDDVASSPALRLRGNAHLPGDMLAAWLGRAWLPQGVSLGALDLTIGGRTLRATATVEAPALRAGAWTATGVYGQVGADVALGAVLPTGDVSLRDVRVESLQGPQSLALEDARVGRVEVRVGSDATVAVRALRAGALTLPTGRVAELSGEADAALGLTGGRYEAALRTSDGRISLAGTLSLELLLGKRLRFQGTARLAGLRGALAAATLQRLGVDGPSGGAHLTPPLSGELRFAGSVTRPRGARAPLGLVPRASWTGGHLEDAAGHRLVRRGGDGRWSLGEGTP